MSFTKGSPAKKNWAYLKLSLRIWALINKIHIESPLTLTTKKKSPLTLLSKTDKPIKQKYHDVVYHKVTRLFSM